MKLYGTIAIALVAATPSALLAQEFYGAATLGYAKSDVSGANNTITTQTLDGRIGTSFGNGISLDARVNGVQGQVSGASGHVSATVLGVSGTYQLPNNFLAGAYAEQATLYIPGISTKLSATSIGLSAGYIFDNTTIKAYYGGTTTSPGLPPGIDIRDYGISANYNLGTQVTLGGNLMRTRITSPTNALNFDTIGIAGAYAANDQVTFFGGLRHSQIDILGGAATTFGVGASYDLSSFTKFRSIISVEYARTDVSVSGPTGSLNTVRVGWTIPFGKKAGMVPLNSVADAVLAPTHSAISTAVLTAF